MKTCDEFIKSAKEKYPNLFKANKVQMTPVQLEQALRMAFHEGFESGCHITAANALKGGESLFDQIFGRGR